MWRASLPSVVLGVEISNPFFLRFLVPELLPRESGGAVAQTPRAGTNWAGCGAAIQGMVLTESSGLGKPLVFAVRRRKTQNAKLGRDGYLRAESAVAAVHDFNPSCAIFSARVMT